MRMNLKRTMSVFLSTLLIVLAFAGCGAKNAEKITEGENQYDLLDYGIEESGLSGIDTIVKKTENFPQKYTLSYFEAVVNKNAQFKSCRFSVDTFDENGDYKGTAGYTYADGKITYYAPKISTDLLVIRCNKNSDFDYLDKMIKKIPLIKQIAVSELENYVITYQPSTQIESGIPIFDGRNNTPFKVLSKKDYNDGLGGRSDGKTSVVIRLNDGSSNVSGQQYLYVFDPADAESAVGNQQSGKKCDYAINGDKLSFTRDYGQTYTDADIKESEISETLAFYGSSLSLPTESVFISEADTLPIAYFYGEKPVLKIGSADKWQTISLPIENDFEKPITRRAVGFCSEKFGYAALGTDWSMGSGERKMCYFTYDGGTVWTKKTLPLPQSSSTLIDIYMANETQGAITLSAGTDAAFPIVFVTSDGGNKWTRAELPFESMGSEVTYLSDIENFVCENGQYALTLGQEDSGTNKAVFTASTVTGQYTFSKSYKAAIHIAG